MTWWGIVWNVALTFIVCWLAASVVSLRKRVKKGVEDVKESCLNSERSMKKQTKILEETMGRPKDRTMWDDVPSEGG